ncbi:RluA family pseudouridine synthase [Hutsoniella sourekii]
MDYQLDGQKGRLDKVLTDLMAGYSRSQVQELIKEGLVLVDQVPQKANYKLTGQEAIQVTLLPEQELEIEAQAMPLDIIYEDADLLVVNKPAGLVVHPSKGHPAGTLVNGLVYHLESLTGEFEGSIRPGIVHRIDKDTSGLLVVAKNRQIHQALAEAISRHEVKRHYFALVHGSLTNQSGVIEVPIGRNKHNRLKFGADPEGKYAKTSFEVLETFPQASLLELELATGRTHQIRVHMEYIGHPIVGDPVYREGIHQMKSTPLTRLQEGQYLHAKTLSFTHPRTGEAMTFTSDLTPAFQALLDQLRSV